jgi:hypothetical protein
MTRTVQTYTAAVDGLARKFYLYPDVTNTPGQYFWGTIFPDFAITSAVDAAIDGTCSVERCLDHLEGRLARWRSP